MDYLSVDRAHCNCSSGNSCNCDTRRRQSDKPKRNNNNNTMAKCHSNPYHMDRLAHQIAHLRSSLRGDPHRDVTPSTSQTLPAIVTTDVDGPTSSSPAPLSGSGSGDSADEATFPPKNTAATRRSFFRRGRRSPTLSHHSGGGGGGHNNHKVTAMLLLVSFAFLVTAVPVTIIQIFFFHIHAEYMKKHEEAAAGGAEVTMDTERLYAKVLLATAIGRVLAYGNHASNFFLYCISGQKFRDEVRQLWWGSSRRRRMRHRRQLTCGISMQHSSSSSSSQKFLIRSDNASCVHITINNDKTKAANV